MKEARKEANKQFKDYLGKVLTEENIEAIFFVTMQPEFMYFSDWLSEYKVVQGMDDSVKVVNNIDLSDDALKWLNKGEADNIMCYGMKDCKAVYTWITKQELKKRLCQHNYSGKGFDYLDEVFDGLTKNQARAVEQYMIENGAANEVNKINSISLNHRFYDEAMKWAEEFIKNLK